MKKLFFAMGLMFFSYSAFSQNTNKILSNYITVKNALVIGDSKAASQAINTLQQSIKDDVNFAQKDALLNATEIIVKAGNIDKQRAAFNNLSINMWKVVSSSKVDNPVYYQYCPMKKAYWLSEEKEIKNPYFGSTMLTCGKLVETK